MGKSEQTCDCEIIHSEVVEQVKKQLESDEEIFNLADFFKIFADTTRIKILYCLDKNELCVCDVAALLNMTISAVSHQLKILRDANLVKTRRDGKVVYYSLSDEHVKEIIECGMEHILEINKNN
ncbi:MAG: metalloregulator ArsR/SmtB family transcription factor [Treponema sp.]|nr:metalloregulator ArsR/SmtB family transcription factor [Treponema sp.]